MESPEARKLEAAASMFGELDERFYNGGEAGECWDALTAAINRIDPGYVTGPGDVFAWLSGKLADLAEAEEMYYTTYRFIA